MKKRSILFAMLSFALMTACSESESDNNDDDSVDGGSDLAVLTFEGSYWTALIDSVEGGSDLLYSEYEWTDSDNTLLHSEFVDTGYGYSIYGGVAISNYSCDVAEGVSYDRQLSVPCEGVGNNDSDNFAVVYADAWAPAEISFSDNLSRVIDHIYLANTSYTASVATYGNDYSEALGDIDYISATITGYDAVGDETDSVIFFLAKAGVLVEGWNLCDLTSLGEVVKITIAVDSSVTNEWGSTIPSYVAIDDIAVQK